MTNAFFVILAGGSGERLWPLSSPARPKQLIPFVKGSCLLELTIQRIQSLVRSKNHLMVVTNADQQDLVKKIVGKQGTVIAEPVGRNTAASVILSALELYEKNADEVMVVLPSDHFIPEPEKVNALLMAATAYAQCYDRIVLLGLKPTFPSTGYGYIQYALQQQTQGWMCYDVEKFHEKPDKENAESYVSNGSMVWNVGMFVGKVKTFIQEFEAHAPELLADVKAYKAGQKEYADIQSVSIDHAVMEKSKNLSVFPADFGWHDVGTLTTFLSLKMKYEQKGSTEVVNVNGADNVAYAGKKTVAFVGVSNLCLVESDNEIVIVAQDSVESVRQVLKELR